MSQTTLLEKETELLERHDVAGNGALYRDSWTDLRASMWREPLDRATLPARLLDLTDDIRDRLIAVRPLEKEWAPLGVEVKQVAMRGRGICSTASESRVIYVNREDPYALQRFTVAHELAHLLLAKPGDRSKSLAPWEEEALCEQFASKLLIERDALDRELAALAHPLGPEDLLRLCGRFRVNVRPMIIAVGEFLAGTPNCLLLARRRGHWRRPDELGFRVNGLAGSRHIFFPPDQRLASLGLRELAHQAERAPHGSCLSGVDAEVEIGLRGLPGKRSSTTIRGPVRWRACRLGRDAPLVLAVMDLS
jgi:hypothetical protein